MRIQSARCLRLRCRAGARQRGRGLAKLLAAAGRLLSQLNATPPHRPDHPELLSRLQHGRAMGSNCRADSLPLSQSIRAGAGSDTGHALYRLVLMPRSRMSEAGRVSLNRKVLNRRTSSCKAGTAGTAIAAAAACGRHGGQPLHAPLPTQCTGMCMHAEQLRLCLQAVAGAGHGGLQTSQRSLRVATGDRDHGSFVLAERDVPF